MKYRFSSLEKMIAVECILRKNPNGISLQQIINRLYDEYGMSAERKSIYTNINVLTRFMDVYTKKEGNKVFYCLRRSDTK